MTDNISNSSNDTLQNEEAKLSPKKTPQKKVKPISNDILAEVSATPDSATITSTSEDVTADAVLQQPVVKKPRKKPVKKVTADTDDKATAVDETTENVAVADITAEATENVASADITADTTGKAISAEDKPKRKAKKTPNKEAKTEQLALEMPTPKNELEDNYYHLNDENQENSIVYLFKSIKNKIRNKKKKAKKRKFNPQPSVHATRYHPDYTIGLKEAEVAERYENDLINKVENKYSKSYRSIFFSNIFTFFNFLGLICAIALIYARAEVSNFFFCIIYLGNIIIGIIQEIRAKLSIEKLSLLSSRSAKVIRNGVESEIATSNIVLDDILKFTLGNQISADSVIENGVVEVNESLLTGESVAVKKSVGDKLYAGSFITSGTCYARADKVGKETYIEILSAKAKKYKKPHSELMRSIQLIITIVGFLIVPIAIGMFIKSIPNSSISESIQTTAAVVIGMIPSGMILLTSFALAIGVIRMSKNNTLVQDLYSLEMLARVDVLCLDKTGTITDGRMKVSDCIILNNNIPNTINEIMGSLLTALNDNNQTSIALNNHFGRNNTLKPLKILPFNSSRKLSAVTFMEVGTYAFGAPEFVMKDIPENVQRMVKQYASMGLRVLLLCYSKSSIVGENIPASMKPIALITITDNIREDAASTIEWFKENGVEIKIISGDNPVTVSDIARRVGVNNASKYISLDGLSESDVINVANKYTVFGRVSPEQKAILIRAIKAAGHTTAMTGDGVNDILALKEANCAISVGSGSDAARNVSHIVLMDSNFSSLPKVVHEGRRVINNIQNSASLYLMKTLFITLLAMIMIVIPGALYPFKTSNLILLEVLIIGFPSAALALQPNNSRVDGKFINYVLSKALPGALLMLISVLVIQLAQQLLTPLYPDFPAEIYTTLEVLAMSAAGLVMLFRICQPYNIFRGVMFSIILVAFLIWGSFAIVKGDAIFLHIIALSPAKTYWQHVLILVTLIIADIPISNWFEKISNNLKTKDKTPKNSKLYK